VGHTPEDVLLKPAIEGQPHHGGERDIGLSAVHFTTLPAGQEYAVFGGSANSAELFASLERIWSGGRFPRAGPCDVESAQQHSRFPAGGLEVKQLAGGTSGNRGQLTYLGWGPARNQFNSGFFF